MHVCSSFVNASPLFLLVVQGRNLIGCLQRADRKVPELVHVHALQPFSKLSAPSDEARATPAMLWYQRTGAPVSSNQAHKLYLKRLERVFLSVYVKCLLLHKDIALCDCCCQSLECEMQPIDLLVITASTHLSNANILGLVALMPNITDSLPSTQLADSLNVHPHQLNLHNGMSSCRDHARHSVYPDLDADWNKPIDMHKICDNTCKVQSMEQLGQIRAEAQYDCTNNATITRQ